MLPSWDPITGTPEGSVETETIVELRAVFAEVGTECFIYSLTTLSIRSRVDLGINSIAEDLIVQLIESGLATEVYRGA